MKRAWPSCKEFKVGAQDLRIGRVMRQPWPRSGGGG